MIIELTENFLLINGLKCSDITLFQTDEGFEATAFNLEGWTYFKEVEDKFKRKIKKAFRQRKSYKSKKCIYSGIDLEDSSKTYLPGGYAIYLYAENKLNPKNYINIYLKDKNVLEVKK